ncbi:Uncharacterised protein [Enterococcus mundtii]|nr:Uncharacterised protein [Enterococcus mundtii]
MNDKLKFWLSALTTILLYYFSFSFDITSISYFFFMSAGTITLLASIYYFSKQKVKGVINFIRYLVHKGHK